MSRIARLSGLAISAILLYCWLARDGGSIAVNPDGITPPELRKQKILPYRRSGKSSETAPSAFFTPAESLSSSIFKDYLIKENHSEPSMLAVYELTRDKEILDALNERYPNSDSAALASFLHAWPADKAGALDAVTRLKSADPQNGFYRLLHIGVLACSNQIDAAKQLASQGGVGRLNDKWSIRTLEMRKALLATGTDPASALPASLRNATFDGRLAQASNVGITLLHADVKGLVSAGRLDEAISGATGAIRLCREYATLFGGSAGAWLTANSAEQRLYRDLPPDTEIGDTGATANSESERIQKAVIQFMHDRAAAAQGVESASPVEVAVYSDIWQTRGEREAISWLLHKQDR